MHTLTDRLLEQTERLGAGRARVNLVHYLEARHGFGCVYRHIRWLRRAMHNVQGTTPAW